MAILFIFTFFNLILDAPRTELYGTSAGLGHLEVDWIGHAKVLPWTVSPVMHYHAVGYGQSE